MERSAWPKNLSSSSKRAIQELCGQNPKKLRDAFDAHSQTGDDPRQPLFAGDLIVSVLGSLSNTQSLSSEAESYEVSQVPSKACVMSGVSKGSESIKSPDKRIKTPVQRYSSKACVMSGVSKGSESIKSPDKRIKTPVQRYSTESVKTPVRVESAKTPIQRSPVESVKTPVLGESVETPVQRSPVESVKTPVQRSPVESVKTPVRGESVETPVWGESVESVETPVWGESVETPVQRSPVSILWEQPLVEAATAIDEGRLDVASEILTRLSAEPNPMRDSGQKLMGYMLSALKSRVSPVDYPPLVAKLFTDEHVSSVRSLYKLSPCFELSFTAANLAILEAASEQPSANKLHVIDFDIGWEGQYYDLLVDLSMRQEGNQFTLKITTLADSFNGEERLRIIGDRLSLLAADTRFRVVFNIVRQKLSELSRDSLGCEPDEVLAVNLAFKLYRMPDESMSAENTRDKLLRRVKGLAPQVVTLVEQEMNGNTAPLPRRVEEALAYYGALLESLQYLEYDFERLTAEEGLRRKLGNWVACEGRDRVERCEVFGKWRARMGMAGFELKPPGRQVAESLEEALRCWGSNWGLTMKEENGGFCLGWRGRTLTVASAWR